MWGQYRKGGNHTEKDDHQESLQSRGNQGKFGRSRVQDLECPTEWGTHDVSGGCYRIQMTLLEIDSEGDDGTDERTELEDGPEDTKCLALILLERVTHHDTSLGRP